MYSNLTGPPPTATIGDYLQIAGNGIFFLLGIPLNIITFVQLIQNYRRTQSRNSFLLLNLNISDFMVLIFYCFGRVCWLVTYEWLAGDFMCRLMRFLESFSFAISSNILVCIALDRLHSLKRPLHTTVLLTPRVGGMVSLAWVLAFLTTLPQLLVFTVFYYPYYHPPFAQCVSIWLANSASENHSEILDWNVDNFYNGYHLVVLFWVPVAILLVSYGLMLKGLFGILKDFDKRNNEYLAQRLSVSQQYDTKVVFKSGHGLRTLKRKPPLHRQVSAGYRNLHKTRLQTLRTTLILVTAYIVFWAPYNCVAVWQIFDQQSYQPYENRLYVLYSLIVLNSVLNPFIYGRVRVKEVFQRARKKLRKIRRKRNNEERVNFRNYYA